MKAIPDARIELRPRGLLECSDLALRFVAVNGRVFTALFAWFVVPLYAAFLALRYAAELEWEYVWQLALIAATFVEGPFTVLCGQAGIREHVRAGEVSRAFVRRLVWYSVASLLVGVAQLIAVVLFVLPWFWVAPATAFVAEVVLLEGSARGTFRRSSRLAMGFGYTGRTIGLVFLLAAVRVGCLLLAESVLRSTLGLVLDLRVPMESLWRAGGSPFALLGLFVSVPICAAIRYMVYIDLRTRREGWDLQRRFHVLAERLASPEAA